MVVNHLDIMGVAASPAKDDSPLVIDPYRMKVLGPTLQPLQPIAGRTRKVAQVCRIMQVQQFSTSCTTKFGREYSCLRRRFVVEKILGEPIAKALNHYIRLS